MFPTRPTATNAITRAKRVSLRPQHASPATLHATLRRALARATRVILTFRASQPAVPAVISAIPVSERPRTVRPAMPRGL